MIGLDRAGIFALVDAPIDLIDIGIKKMYPHILKKKMTGNTQSYSIGRGNINEIKVVERLNKTSRVAIDFSYPRSNATTNLYPMTSEVEKEIVDNKILELIKEISMDKEITTDNLFYDYLEVATQETVGGFYKFHNVIILFFRALSHVYSNEKAVVHSNYKDTIDRFYTTGISFKIMPGMELNIYSKGHEHNKNNDEKVKGGIIKLEQKMYQKSIKKICGTNSVSDLSIQDIKNSFIRFSKETLFNLIVDELTRCEKILENRFSKFDSRELSGLVRDFEEWIYDEKIINSVITRTSKKSEPQIRRYKSTVKVALRESQIRSSPSRDNFGNIERLGLFINKLLLIKCEVKCSHKKHLTFNFVKNDHKHERFLKEKK